LNRVEKINSNFSGLHLTRGGIYLKLKQIEKAKESLNKAVEFGSNNALKILEKLNK
jgi:Tfp pilus assembly protein PilF